MTRILLCAVLALSLAAADFSRITARMQKFVDQGTAAGFVTLLARHDNVIQLSAVGFQDLESKTPMRTDTIFQIASMTKPITSVGVMILAEDGLLSVSDPVAKYLPEFAGQKLKNGERPSRPITLRDLLTHTSGMPGSYPEGYNRNREHTLAEAVTVASQLQLQFEPGTQWSYSNTGMATLGRIIEVVSGQPYEHFLDERIFSPLGMKDTFFFPPVEKYSRIAAIYTDDHGKLRRADIDLYRKGAKYPGPEGGLYSTATDLARFYRMMLNNGTLDGHRILSKAGVSLMTRNHTGDLTAGFAPGMGYGLGWSVVRNFDGMFRLNSLGAYGHGGAYRTYGWIDPPKDLVGVILYQRTNGGGDMADEITAFMTMAAASIE